MDAPRLLLALLVVLVGCGGGTEDRIGVDESGTECDQPLPPTSSDGTPWPSYDAAHTVLADCEQLDGYWFRRRGTCADGKRFLEKGGGFVGDTYYFAGEQTVGVSRWTDIIGACRENRLGDATCDEVSSEEITCAF